MTTTIEDLARKHVGYEVIAHRRTETAREEAAAACSACWRSDADCVEAAIRRSSATASSVPMLPRDRMAAIFTGRNGPPASRASEAMPAGSAISPRASATASPNSMSRSPISELTA